MASSRHSPSRRAILGAIPALAVMGTVGATAAIQATGSSEFARRFAAYERAKAEADRYYVTHTDRINDRHDHLIRLHGADSAVAKAYLIDHVRPAERAHGDRVEAYFRRLKLALLTPVTVASDLVRKLSAFIAEEVWDHSEVERILATLLADANRLNERTA